MKKKENKNNSLPLLIGGVALLYLAWPKNNGSGGGSGSGSGGGSGLPRGIRNNNIGNLKIRDENAWVGKIPREQNTDGVFEQFTTKEYGTRAMLKILARYYNEYDLFNIEDIIKRYDHPLATHYINEMAKRMNLTTISYIEPQRMFELAYHMADFENGMEATTINELKAVANKYGITFNT